MPLTVLEESILEKEVLHSKFIVSLRHIEGDDAFGEHLSAVKDKYPKAAHYCYGARIGSIEKMGDDGEPSHSAGLQILSALRYKKLDNVSIIVARYFGGVKLGLPRLTRTYRECAEEILSTASFFEAEPGLKVTLVVSYPELESLKYQLDKKGFQIGNIDYEEEVFVSFMGEQDKVKEFISSFGSEKVMDSESTTLYKEVRI